MTENTDDKLTVAEETLRDVLAIAASARTGTTARTHGWPQPDELQCGEMTRLLVRVATEFVRVLRHPDARPPSQDELVEVLEGFALGVLEKVMGTPTPDIVH